MNFSNAEFVKSAASERDFINDGRPQIVFAGRSNVGKSSVINRLTGRKNLARVGSTPGMTAHINYFLIDRTAYFADLPGYGYAKVSEGEKKRWAELLESYFAKGLVSLGVMIVDSRHRPTADDVTMANWFKSTGCPLIVVANKSDKLKKSEIEPNIEMIKSALGVGEDVPVILFSAEKGTGRDELISEILRRVGK